MSGGTYDYASVELVALAEHIRENAGCRNLGDGGTYGASPALRRAFKEHLRKVAAALRAIEWNDSGDGDDDEVALIRAVVGPAAELEQATTRAREALAELEQAIEEAEKT